MKAFDNIETVLRYAQGNNSIDFNYGFSLSYGERHTDYNELTAIRRQLIHSPSWPVEWRDPIIRRH